MLATLVKAILSLRYSVSVDSESISALASIPRQKGVLILPNHPAEIDPVIISTHLWDVLRPQPVVLETIYNLPFIRPLMKRLGGVPMPDMDFDAGPHKRRRITRTLEGLAERLRRGENILLYPAGRLSVTGTERLGATSGLYTILQHHPEVPLVLVRIRGLYGSIFSKALTGGHRPDLALTFKESLKVLVQNLVFFSPRRKVTLEIVTDPADFPRSGDALTINRYLERFYNSPNPETPTLVPHRFWSDRTPPLPQQAATNHTYDQISPAIRDRVFAHIAKIANTDPGHLTMDTDLGHDLGLDSLTVAELLVWLDREFGIHDLELSELITVGSVVRAAAGELGNGETHNAYTPAPAWHSTPNDRPTPILIKSANIAEAFLLRAETMSDLPAIGDGRSGVVSWSDLKLRTIILARFLRSLPDQHIGLLFPASVGGSIAIMAAILAGKTPVLINWTAGQRAILHACESTGLKTILTSQAFLDIVPSDLEFLEGRFLFLEEIREKLSIRDKLCAKRLARESSHQLMRAFGITEIDRNTQALVLFTSGSEALPKGVVLTHGNILANIEGVLASFPITQRDILLGFLPTFHSFGLTICTILPLLTGLRVAYHPNPNESRKLAKAISDWGASIVAGTPTFLRAILSAGSPQQFNSLRAMITGAERAPQALFEAVSNLTNHVDVIEGYGITECAPVVSITRANEPHIGVGRPILGIEIKVLNPETLVEVADGAEGLIVIRGASVFPGYLERELNPFVEINGDKFYNSGDIGKLQNGSLIITGRLKRFAKIAGEMISLTAIEECLSNTLISDDEAPHIAVIAIGSEGQVRPTLILFTTREISTESANRILWDAGFPHLVNITRVIRVESIPLLGSGKTAYQELKELIA